MIKRNYEIKVRFSKNEFDFLNRNVALSKMNREQYIRDLVAGYSPREAPPIDYYTLICDLRRVGANLNQVLRIANTKGFIDVPLLRKVIEGYRQTERMIWSAFEVANA